MFRRNAIVLLSLIAVGLGGWFGTRQFQSAGPTPNIVDFTLPDILEQPQDGAQWLGDIVVVNHWASWCPPCIKEIPLLIDVQTRYQDRGLQVVGIAHDTLDATRVFGDQMGINYPSLVATTGGGELMNRFGSDHGSGLPFTAFFDRQGNLVETRIGLLHENDLVTLIESLL